jgi:hypothetical protein
MEFLWIMPLDGVLSASAVAMWMLPDGTLSASGYLA